MRISRLGGVDNRKVLTVVLAGAFCWSLFQVEWSDGVVHSGGFGALGDMAASIVRPQVDAEILMLAFREAWRTVAFAVAGLTVALFIGFPIGVVGSGVVAGSSLARGFNIGPARLILAAMRSVHELVWAWFFVAAFGLSPMAAVLAIGIPYGGILGRIYAESLQDVPDAPLRALRSSGANGWQVLFYGRLPMVGPDILSYTFYRLECGIRAAAVMSFVGLGGLGHQIQLSLQDLAYGRIWTFLLVLILLIAVVDTWSTALRRRMYG